MWERRRIFQSSYDGDAGKAGTDVYKRQIMPSAANYPYEIYSEKLLLEKALPTIVSAKETVEMIRKEKKSLSRFGDNEFELILGRERTNYQTAKQELGVRLEQVLKDVYKRQTWDCPKREIAA